MRRLLALLLALPLAAGCLAGAPGDAPAPATDPAALVGWAERAIPFGDPHDHFDPAQHANLSTPNFELLGWDPLVSDATGATAGGYFCGDAKDDGAGRRLAVVNSFYSGIAFVVADVTDPAHPHKLGEMTLPYESVYDVALTPDAKHAVVLANPDTSPALPGAARLDLAAPGATWRDACTGRVSAAGLLPNGPATLLVSLEDPSSPQIVDSFPSPFLGGHSVTTASIDNRSLVAVSTTNLVHQASYYQFFEVKDGKLSLLTTYQAPPPASANQPTINGHVDANLMKHPVTGQLLAYLADWDRGVVILDLGARVPTVVGEFNPFTGRPGDSYQTGVESGNVHEAIPLPEMWDGRHYVLAGQEILGHPQDHPSGWVWILDDTDPADVQLVGRWTLPYDVEWEMGLQFSTHYMTVVDRTMFVSLYHGGVWAVDLSPENLSLPQSVGAFVPANVSPSPGEIGGSDVVGTPTVMEAIPLPGGDLVVFDAQSGVYVVRYHPEIRMPAVAPWPGAALE